MSAFALAMAFEAEGGNPLHAVRSFCFSGTMAGHALFVLWRHYSQSGPMLMARTALPIDRLRGVKGRGGILCGKLIVRVVTSNANVVFLAALDGFSGVRPSVQFGYDILVTTCAPVNSKEVSQRLVDMCGIGMRDFFGDGHMAFATGNLPVDRSVEAAGVNKP
jgi:hypothetical protein